MKNVVRKLLLTCALLISVISVSAQLVQHGLLLSGGTGSVNNDLRYYRLVYSHEGGNYYGSAYAYGPYWSEYEYNAGLSVGYRLRFNMPAHKSFHYDLDMNIGAKILKASQYGMIPDPPNETGNIEYFTTQLLWANGPRPYYFTSIGGTANYSIAKNLSIGLGLEPTLFLNKEGKSNADIPIVAKAAYNFGVIEVGIAGKYGLSNALQSSYTSGKIREIQLSFFIPLKTKKK